MGQGTWQGRTWREIARERILVALAHRRLESAPWVTDQALLKVVRRQDYPFGERSMWPYKAWLLAIQDAQVYVVTGLWPGRRRKPRPVVLEQLSLPLDGNALKWAQVTGEAQPATAGPSDTVK